MNEAQPADMAMADRAQRVTSVLQEVIARRATGESIADEQVIAAHGDLAPELREHLRALQVVERAESRARLTASSHPASTPHDHGPLPTSFAGYDVRHEIHRGGQGVVYLAVHRDTGRQVAIKVLREHPFTAGDGPARLEREVQVLRRLRHPNIVAIHESGFTADGCFLVMDYLAGCSLDEHLVTAGAAVRPTVALFAKIGWAVHAAHVRGIIHRDLKPANIRIDEAGEPHVLDFGLAKLMSPTGDALPPASAMTRTGQFVGSLPWASPEQADFSPDRVDLRTDIYALGVMLYQALAGTSPYPLSGTFTEVLNHILHTTPQRPSVHSPQVNDELDTIVLKCLAKDRERRYQSAAELARDLERFLADEPIEAKRDSTWYLVRKTLHRHRLATAATACAVALLGASAVWLSVLYRAEAQARSRAEQSATRANTVQRFLQSMLAPPRPAGADRGDGATSHRLIAREALMRFGLDRAAARLDTELTGQPEVEATVRATMGRAYHRLGLFTEAEQHLRRALEIREALFTRQHLDVAASLNDLGELLYDRDDFDAAEACFREALVMRRRLCTGDDSQVAESLQNLAWLLQSRRQYAEAEPLYAAALAMLRRVRGDDSIEAARVLSRWGQLDFVRRDHLAAERHFDEARTMLTRLGAEESPEAAALLVQLGKLYQATGRFAAAEPLLREALDLTRRLDGDVHPNVAWGLQRLGMLLHAQGRFAEAAPLLREACAIYEATLAPDSPSLARGYEHLGLLLSDWGDGPGAEQACRNALAVWARRCPPGDPYLTWCAGRLGCVLAARGDFSAAEPLITAALEQRDLALEDEAEQLVATLFAQAAILQARGESAEAIEVLRSAQHIAETRIGHESPEALAATARLRGGAEPQSPRATPIGD